MSYWRNVEIRIQDINPSYLEVSVVIVPLRQNLLKILINYHLILMLKFKLKKIELHIVKMGDIYQFNGFSICFHII